MGRNVLLVWAKDEVDPWPDEVLEVEEASSNLMGMDGEGSYE